MPLCIRHTSAITLTLCALSCHQQTLTAPTAPRTTPATPFTLPEAPPNTPSSEPTSVAEVESEFAREMQRLGPPVLPPGVTLRPICCVLTNVSGAPAGMALSLLLPPINGFANEGQPTAGVGAAYTVQMGPPFRVLSRPDLAAVRPRVNGFAVQASRAVAVALQRLNALPQSAQWRTRRLRISTNVVAADHEQPPVQWNVYFTAFVTPRNGPNDSLNVFVDASAETVLDTYAGAGHVRVAPK